MEKLESVQYAAALAVTGTWRGTSRERLYNELGWEPLSLRRWSRRLILFYKFLNELTPDYTRDPIPPLNETSYPIRNRSVVGQIRARTERFKASFYPHCLLEWNKLDPEIRASSAVGIFKKKLSSQIRPPANSVYGIHNPKGVAYLTQLRVGLSKLNFHKFRHNFRDTINPMCPINDGVEDTEHSCCFATLIKNTDVIFSLMLMLYYKIVGILSGATAFCNFFCTVIRVCLMRQTDQF